MKLLNVVMAGLAISCAAPAVAAERPSKADKEDVGDANRRICRSEPVLGSRVAKTRRCLTAAEWSEIKSADRQLVERVQGQRIKNE